MKKFLLIVLVCLPLASCEFLPSVDESRAALADAKIALAEAEAERDRLLSSGEATSEQLENADKTLAAAQEYRDAAERLIGLSEEQGPDFLQGVTAAVGTATGQPGIALIGVAIAGFWRARRNRAVADNLVRSMEPIVNSASEQERAHIRSIQTSATKMVVDQSQGKRKSFGI